MTFREFLDVSQNDAMFIFNADYDLIGFYENGAFRSNDEVETPETLKVLSVKAVHENKLFVTEEEQHHA